MQSQQLRLGITSLTVRSWHYRKWRLCANKPNCLAVNNENQCEATNSIYCSPHPPLFCPVNANSVPSECIVFCHSDKITCGHERRGRFVLRPAAAILEYEIRNYWPGLGVKAGGRFRSLRNRRNVVHHCFRSTDRQSPSYQSKTIYN